MSRIDPASGVRLLDATVGYVDGAEDELLGILRSPLDRSSTSDELGFHVHDWPTRYHLSRLRANLLRPLRIGPQHRVLDVGAGTGALARYLGEQGARVVALEGSLDRARGAAARCENLPDVEVVCGSLDAFDDPDGFDVVVCCGVLEYAGAFGRGPEEFLRQLRTLTTDTGVLVLAIENQLGLKYLLGYGEDHLGTPWSGVEGYPGTTGVRTYSRRALQTLLAGGGFGSQRWLYPYPDYKLPRVVLSDAAFERDDHTDFVDQLVRWPCSDDASAPARVCDTRGAHRVLLEADLGREVANSFVALAAAGDDPLDGLLDPTVVAWHFGNERLSAWMSSKVFSASADDLDVRSDPAPRPAEIAARGWLRHELAPVRAFRSCRTMEQEALDTVTGNPEQLEAVLRTWRDHLLKIAAPGFVDNDVATNPFRTAECDHVLPEHYLDVSLSNFVVTADGELDFIDTEWHVAGGVDADLVCARALWWFARDLVVHAIAHPWPRSANVTEITAALCGLCDVPWNEDRRSRIRRAEAELQHLVTGASEQELLESLDHMSGLSQLQPPALRHLPFTTLRADAVRLDAEVRDARAERDRTEARLEAGTLALEAERTKVAERETTLAAAEAALGREAELNAELRKALEHRDEVITARDTELHELRDRWTALERRLPVRMYRRVRRLFAPKG